MSAARSRTPAGYLPDFRDIENESLEDRIAANGSWVLQALNGLTWTVDIHASIVWIDEPAELCAAGGIFGHAIYSGECKRMLEIGERVYKIALGLPCRKLEFCTTSAITPAKAGPEMEVPTAP